LFFIEVAGREEDVYVVDVDAQVGVGSGAISKSYSIDEIHGLARMLEGDLAIKSASLKHPIVRFSSSFFFELREDVSKRSRLVDEFFISPFVTKIASGGGDVEYIVEEVTRNNELVLRWQRNVKFFNFSSFRYILPGEVPDVPYLVLEGYRGARVKIVDSPWFTTLYSDLSYVRMPLIVEVFSRRGLDQLERFVEGNEVGGKLENPVVVIPYIKETIRPELYGFMGVGNVFLSLSPMPLTFVKQVIYSLSEMEKEWFKRLVFGTGFPYSSVEDVAKTILFFLGEDFPGGLRELRWIMGLNAVSLLPPKADRRGGVEQEDRCFMVDAKVSKKFLSSFKDVMTHALKRESIAVTACDYLIDMHQEKVDLGKCFINLASTRGEKKVGNILVLAGRDTSSPLMLLLLKLETVRKIRSRFTEDIAKTPEIRSAISRAVKVLSEEDAELTLQELINHFKDTSLISHEDVNLFTIHTFQLGRKVAQMNDQDMRLLNLKNGDLALVRVTLTGDWYVVPVTSGEDVLGGELHVDEGVINNWYVFDGDTVHVEKFEGNVPMLEEVSFVVEENEGRIGNVEEVLEDALDGIIVGKNSRFVLPETERIPPVAIVASMDPEFSTVGLVKKGKTRVRVVSKAALKPYNMIFAIDLSENMGKGSLPLKDRGLLNELKSLAPSRIDLLEGEFIRRNIGAALISCCLLTRAAKLSRLRKIFSITYSKEASLFSILERRRISPYLELTPQKKNIVLKVLSSHIFDKCREPGVGKGDLTGVLEKIREILENLKESNPVVVLFMIPQENVDETLKAVSPLKNDSRVRSALVCLGGDGVQEVEEGNCIYVNEISVAALDRLVDMILGLIE